MTTIYLIRHAEAEGNLYRRAQGSYDGLVTERGKKQIEMLSTRFENIHIDAVYSSDLLRTQMTASAIFLTKNLPLYSCVELREADLGVWEDMTWYEAEMKYPEQMLNFSSAQGKWKVPGCENFTHMQERMLGIMTKLAVKHDAQTIAVASHGTVIRAFVAAINGLFGDDISKIAHSDNTGVTKLEYANGKYSVEYYGDISHLPAELSTFSTQSWWKNPGGKDSTCLWYRTYDLADDREFFKSDNPKSTYIAMHEDVAVGIVELDVDSCKTSDTGIVKTLYIAPEYQGTSFEVQLIGQAVSVYRKMSKEKILTNSGSSQKFLLESGFVKTKIGYELDISYNWRKGKNIVYEQF